MNKFILICLLLVSVACGISTESAGPTDYDASIANDADMLEVISYGEERPAVEGHSEQAYAKNRRVVIAY